jgi:glycosyltransferase involved in cell wall biosynthesis
MEQMKKQVVIIQPMDSFHPRQGGDVRYMMNALHAFVAQEWQVTVLGFQRAKAPEPRPWRQVSLCEADWRRFLVALYARLPFMRLAKNGVALSHRMDCVLPFVLFRKSQITVLVAAPPMQWLRLTFPRLFPMLRRFYQMAERKCMSELDLLIPVDEDTEAYYLCRYPEFGGKITRMPSAIDLSRFHLIDQELARESIDLPAHERIVIFLGRLAPVKNLPLLLRAFETVRLKVPNSRLLLVGAGECEREVRDLVTDHESVTFAGEVNSEQVALYLNAADVLALCSTREGSPTVVKEALACGLPVVSTDVGDVRMTLSADDSLGCIVSADEQDLARGLIRWLACEKSDDLTRSKRRQAVRKYDAAQVMGHLVQMCEDLVQGSCRK